MALGATPRVDFGRLRAQRRRAVLAAMAEAGLDVLVLGREDNARYVSGARRLWTSGTRPFGPGCVVVADGGRVHLLSTWTDGVPAEIPFDACYGLSWDGATVASRLAAIDGVARATRIGVDGMTVGAARLLGHVAPHATVVDAGVLLARVRAVKHPDELACLRTAVAAAESAAVAAGEHLSPGHTGHQAAGRFLQRLGSLGLSITDGPPVVAPPTPHGLPLVSSTEAFADGQLVAVRGAAFFEGYRGDAGWTWRCHPSGPQEPPAHLRVRWQRLRAALVSAARAGRPAADLRRAWEATGEAVPPTVLAHGVGLGMEPPVVSCRLEEADAGPMAEGSVLALRGQVWDDRDGGLSAVCVVQVGPDGGTPLSRLDAVP